MDRGFIPQYMAMVVLYWVNYATLEGVRYESGC